MAAPDIDEGTQRFLRMAAGHRLLSAREEKELARAAAKGDTAARHKLLLHNLRLVVSIARHYRNRGLPFADVIQDGILGLDRATIKFDPERGYKFSTYATLWIRQAIRRGLSGTGSTIRLPPQVAERRAKARAALLKDPMRDLQELAESLELEAGQLANALGAAEVVTSLDREISIDDDYAHTLLDTLADPLAHDPAHHLPETNPELHDALADLEPLQQKVIRLRFGFDGEAPMSLAEVAERLGYKGTTTVQAAQREALKQLRAVLESPSED